MYHPSVNLKYLIEDEELQLTRGERGSDRNPFFDSYHNVNIDAENISWQINADSLQVGKKSIGYHSTKDEVTFESLKYFEEGIYMRLQNISSVNPIATFKRAAEQYGNEIDALRLAESLDPNYDISSIKSMLYDMAAKGFLHYNSETEKVHILDKIYHYADAAVEKTDYDLVKVHSASQKNVNATLSFSDMNYVINDVTNLGIQPCT